VKLFYSPASPYVRKCMVVALEVGLADRIETLPSAVSPIKRDPTVVARNPLGKVPTLTTDDGQVLYDSRVICEYLNDLGRGTLVPASGPARWRVQTEQALGDGILDAALLMRYEAAMRPEALRWAEWSAGQLEKVHSGLAEIEANAASYGDTFDLGKITLACMLGYLDFRFASLDWRAGYPGVAAWHARIDARASMAATRPRA
jgi:glutathione S-transferase